MLINIFARFLLLLFFERDFHFRLFNLFENYYVMRLWRRLWSKWDFFFCVDVTDDFVSQGFLRTYILDHQGMILKSRNSTVWNVFQNQWNLLGTFHFLFVRNLNILKWLSVKLRKFRMKWKSHRTKNSTDLACWLIGKQKQTIIVGFDGFCWY